jgi:predicted ATPase/DNA-binding SARP family transcriptional activator
VEFAVLGPLQVTASGAEVEIRDGLARSLLAALVLRAPERVSADTLIDLLWGDELPRNPANALQIQVSRVRKVLSSASPLGQQPIVTHPGGYALDVDSDAIDANRFERVVVRCTTASRTGDDSRSQADLDSLGDALSLWRGEPFFDIAGHSIVQGVTTRLEELRWIGHELRTDLLLALGRHREAVGELSQLVAAQPLRERFREQLIVALYRCGRQADALRAYESARSTLVEELGLDPGPMLQQLERQVLAHDPSLDWQQPTNSASNELSEMRSADWRRSYVPAPTTALIGRASEVTRIGELMTRSRLVTLTGPGGAGKTRLAIDLASRQASVTEVWYVDLSAIDLPELVAPAIASAIGATTGPTEDAVDVVSNALARDGGLLVLDTCEHVLSGAGMVTSAILRRAPGLRILATSRRPLGLAGETAWPVPPLGMVSPDTESVAEIGASPAVQLFCERAQAVQPDFALTVGNAADIAAICLALDGLPLAIELAAARVDVLAPVAIRERLLNRFDLLVEGAVDAAERHQTLRAAIDWSVELLSPEQRIFFARLSVFAGGFDLAAAEAVAGDDGSDVLALLTSLLRHSMVARDGPDRFRLLDTLRAYSEQLLADLDADATRRRHAHHYASVAERHEALVLGPRQIEGLARLRAETPNLRDAVEWSLSVGDLDIAARLAGSLAWFWVLDGRLDVAHRHLQRAIDIDSDSAVTRSKVLWGYALLESTLGNLEQAANAAELSVALAREADDDAALGASLNALAVAQWAMGNTGLSIAAHDEAIERFMAAGEIWGESICRVLRARTAFDLDDPTIDTRIETALEVARKCGDRHVIGIGLGLRAQRDSKRSNREDAINAVVESLELYESIGYTEGTISALHQLAQRHANDGDDDVAGDLLVRALRLAWKMQHAAAVCEGLEELARIEVRRGSPQRAWLWFKAAEAEREHRRMPRRASDQSRADELVHELRECCPVEPAPRATVADAVAEAIS